MELSSDKKRSYELNGFLFYPQDRLVERLQDNHKASLYPKEAELLELFLTDSEEILTNQKIAAKVWQTSNLNSVKKNIRQSVYSLRRILGNDMIKTVFDEGYRFVKVENSLRQTLSESEDQEIFSDTSEQNQNSLITAFGGYYYFVLTESLLYSTVAVISLYLETAYRLSEFLSQVVLWSFPVFVTAFFVSAGSFWISYFFVVKKYSDKGIVVGGLSLLIGTVLVVLIGFQALPDYPITQTTAIFQSQPAQIAYLKDLNIYLLPIFFIMVTVPYVSILTWQRELNDGNNKELLKFLRSRVAYISGTANLSVKLMLIGLFLLFLYSFSSTFYLFNNLEPSENLNIFIYLAIVRNSIYFLVGLIGVGWYYENRNKIIVQCRKS